MPSADPPPTSGIDTGRQSRHRAVGRHGDLLQVWGVPRVDLLVNGKPFRAAVLAEHRVQEVPVPVDRAIQVAPFFGDVQVRFVEIPGHAPATATLLSELLGKE